MSTSSLYELLGIQADADAAAIKRAYLKAARDTHPDKNGGDEAATERFQQVGRAYAVLSDAEKRKLYDETGMVDDGSGGGGDASYWREAFERVSLEKLDALAASYRHTEEEAADLRAHYIAAKGDMGKVMDAMMFSTADDEPRFRETLRGLVEAGELRMYRQFEGEKDSKRLQRERRAAKEAAEAEAAAAELGLSGGGDDALKSALMARGAARQSEFGSMLQSLEGRYGGAGGGKAGKAPKGGKSGKQRGGSALPEDPLSDEAFAAAQQRVQKRGRAGR